MRVEWYNDHPDTVLHPGMWDDTWLQELLQGVHGPVPEDGTVVVVPGRYHSGDIEAVNARLQAHESVLLIVTADEANEFPSDLLTHERLVVWVQTLRPGRFTQGFAAFPLGYPPHTRQWVAETGFPPPVPFLDWYFAGQITHVRRALAVEALEAVPCGDLLMTEGFTQGRERRVYLRGLQAAKVAPCPSGPVTQETLRMWEALATGTIPIADALPPEGRDDGFWLRLFDGVPPPFPIIRDWSKVPEVIGELLEGWPHTANVVQAWYSKHRRMWAQRLTNTLTDLTGSSGDFEQVTVLIPTSPIPSHPETAIIEETVASVRERFPASDIRIMVDGVRPEQWHRTPMYQEYTRRLLWLAHNRWWNVTVTLHDVHKHQAQMARDELAWVTTPLLLYVEHDTPLINDWPVARLIKPLLQESAYIVRMNHEHQVHPDHEHLMEDPDVTHLGGLPMRRTNQWSQRPHLARVDRYRDWLDEWFTQGERSMIEDTMHSVIQRSTWDRYRVWLYTPKGNQQRSIHTDARGSDPKWPNVGG